MGVPSDLEDELRKLLAGRAERMPAELGKRAGHARAARRVRRYAPLAAAFGVVVAATAGVLLGQFGTHPPNRSVAPPSAVVSSVDIAPTTTVYPVRHGCPTTGGPARSGAAAAGAGCSGGH